MKYHNITTDDMLNGDGLRVVLWVSGCNHFCKGCQNPVTWDENDGIEFNKDALEEIIVKMTKPYISGLTLSGGDPLYPNNRDTIYRLVKQIKEIFPNKTIWLYTGYSYEEIKDLPIMEYIDVVVDGEFEEDSKDVNYHWAGSTNQRVIRLGDIDESI